MLHVGRRWGIRRSLLFAVAVASVAAGSAFTAQPALASVENEKLVNQIYRDLALRPVKPTELPKWVKLLDKGNPPFHIAGQVQRMQSHRYAQVRRLFADLLNRKPTDGELAQYGGELIAGRRVEHVTAEIMALDEYLTNRGGGTNDGFVDAVFTDATGALPDTVEHDAFVALLTKNSRQKVARMILNTEDAYNFLVRKKFKYFIRRFPTSGEQAALVQLLLDGEREETVVSTLVGMPEYFDYAQTHN